MGRVLKPGIAIPSNTKVILLKAKRLAMDALNLMVITMKVNSKMAHSMVKVHIISMIPVRSIKENLKKIILLVMVL